MLPRLHKCDRHADTQTQLKFILDNITDDEVMANIEDEDIEHANGLYIFDQDREEESEVLFFVNNDPDEDSDDYL